MPSQADVRTNRISPILLYAAALGAAVALTLALPLPSAAADAAQAPPPARVVTAPIHMRSVAENDSFIGLFYYDRAVNVSTEVNGLVKKVEVKEGDKVKKGDPLVRLDTELLDQEAAALRTQMEKLELNIDYTGKNYKRLDELYKREGVSEKALDDARYDWQDAKMALEVARRSLETLEIRQAKSVVYAPFTGVVLEKSVETGDWVSQGKTLVRIGASDELYLRVPIAERMLRHIKVGGKVPVVITAYDKKLTGTVSDIAPIADAQTKNIFVKVAIPPVDGVAENMSATVNVPTSSKRNLAMIPRDALIKFNGKDFVYTVKEGKAAILPVNIVSYLGDVVGADNPYFVEGMPVVVDGNERLRPDQPVAPVAAEGK